MKVILYMAISVNGMIARDNDDTSWVSKDSWKSYLEIISKTGAAIVGNKTFQLMKKDEFIENCTYVVVSRKEQKISSDNILSATSVKSALELLESKQISQACIIGGGEINAAFMKAGLIDEVFLDIEPILLGKGIPLFKNSQFTSKLELIETRKIWEGTLQLHYRVVSV
ncbi:hypothetical protein A3F34_03220 [Candidatus Roizmanbacteria bacterium RIFCSPHIGHO2_12_FULL_44_10]|uniref:Bacterial bifunctional deaminase-reductase C-terminal domain-containing protein n=1 Tax=Candidatus Roizmanbacteria bacterium RIFCSPHIGHO2_12_FULL_44_10 TaxID=1802054 RepID=A0A1F7IB22_9BACT|nr:MAG: hypothetical protein A3F34_03220 [Candidatus Roizmanbacteria bacterium RIFCSPHIGHO2_12_FULL_44_10]